MTRSTQTVPPSRWIGRRRRPKLVRRRARASDSWGERRESNRIRVGRVLSAQARIAAGHYDRPEVREYLVDALLVALRRH